jgi:hypothetical protein
MMKFATGHRTITAGDNRRSYGRLFRGAREGDVYLAENGNHWVCHGTQTGKTVMGETHTWTGPAVQLQNLPKSNGKWGSWKTERAIPADVDVTYETSYTKQVVDALEVLERRTPRAVKAIAEAVALLKDYHVSLHAPYAQRDKARAEAEHLRREVSEIAKERDASVKELRDLKRAIYQALA